MTPRDVDVSQPEIGDALTHVIDLLEQIAAALARIEQRQERTNELLDRIDKAQYS